MTSAHPFTLEQIDSGPVSLETLSARGPVVLVFAHADCPTSTLTLRRLAAIRRQRATVRTARASPRRRRSRAAQLARRTGIRFPVLAEPAPFEVSRAYGIETVPTAVRIEPGAARDRTRVVGWDAERVRAPARHAAADRGAARKPGCGARWTYEARGRARRARGHARARLERRSAGHPADARAGRGDARRRRPGALARPRAAGARRGDARAHRRLRRPRGMPPCLLPGRAGGSRGRARAGLQRSRDRGDDPAGRPDPRRQRACARAARDQRRHGRARPRHAREHDDRPCAAPPPHADRRRAAGRARSGDARSSGQARDLLRGERGGEPLGAAPRRARLRRRRVDRDARRGRTLRSRSPTTAAERPRSSRRRSRWAAAGQWSPYWWPMADTSLFVVCPEHATLFAAAGGASSGVRAAMFEAVQRPAAELRRGETTPLVHASADDALVREVDGRRIGSRSSSRAARRAASRRSSGPATACRREVVTKEIRWST